ncbi:hypothetical protein CKM354_000497900 [Cercospora kikuchii]|uniref:Uncharacterized protein n=1 Tax=Cercospora kikuchii TaxID=84275 RepID=A0A9P3CF88_9PEZI|nr:uncharacterized protein CKM354_000497900 [Cercospora kikuchii]GIZ41681.1 hypothetical protein CKM354_000497900 [Cercospora kikuchii]
MASNLYTTKSLGKEWLPSPVRGGRFANHDSHDGPWSPLNSPKVRSAPRYEAPKTWKSSSRYSRWRRWTRPYERIILASIILLVFWTFHGDLQQRISNFQHNLHALMHSSPPPNQHLQHSEDPTWSQYAYHFHAHDPSALCSAVIHLQTLQRLSSKPSRLLTYPSSWTSSSAPLKDNILRLLRRAENDFHALLQPVDIPLSTYQDSKASAEYAKFLPFNQSQYTRIAHLHPKSTILSQSLDDIFLFSSADTAMPRKYWLQGSDSNLLSDLLLLVQPDQLLFERLVSLFTVEDPNGNNALASQQQPQTTFMSTLVKLVEEATFLPHREYLLRDGEFFRSGDHSVYLGTDEEVWDPMKVIDEAKFVVFDDEDGGEGVGTRKGDSPECGSRSGELRTAAGAATCAEKEIWKWLVRDRRDRRMALCGVELAEEDVIVEA